MRWLVEPIHRAFGIGPVAVVGAVHEDVGQAINSATSGSGRARNSSIV